MGLFDDLIGDAESGPLSVALSSVPRAVDRNPDVTAAILKARAAQCSVESEEDSSEDEALMESSPERTPRVAEKAAKTPEQLKEEKSRTLFVSNVPVEATAGRLVKFLQLDKSLVETVVFRGVPIDPKYRKIGNKAIRKGKLVETCSSKQAFVRFASRSEVAKTLRSFPNAPKLDGHRLCMNPCELRGRAAFDPKSTVFVRRLPFYTEEDVIWEYFENTVGPVKGVKLLRDPVEHTSKQAALVCFQSKIDVLKAKQLSESQQLKIHVRVLQVEHCLDSRALESIKARGAQKTMKAKIKKAEEKEAQGKGMSKSQRKKNRRRQEALGAAQQTASTILELAK
ncbi:MAG: uncharacterized protein KVP18_001801 [Porospora cf. gigantea A]|uniref:uncharacterized protein n=1 Tax=Porospora cf. gigantea A TaxID=2853593 RepID=UPI003559EFBD|nr:MAG: hypothetical protein KVP18_001801 [Porospora cf. gigantea A]